MPLKDLTKRGVESTSEHMKLIPWFNTYIVNFICMAKDYLSTASVIAGKGAKRTAGSTLP